jgi:hypothetical protein
MSVRMVKGAGSSAVCVMEFAICAKQPGGQYVLAGSRTRPCEAGGQNWGARLALGTVTQPSHAPAATGAALCACAWRCRRCTDAVRGGLLVLCATAIHRPWIRLQLTRTARNDRGQNAAL